MDKTPNSKGKSKNTKEESKTREDVGQSIRYATETEEISGKDEGNAQESLPRNTGFSSQERDGYEQEVTMCYTCGRSNTRADIRNILMAQRRSVPINDINDGVNHNNGSNSKSKIQNNTLGENQNHNVNKIINENINDEHSSVVHDSYINLKGEESEIHKENEEKNTSRVDQLPAKMQYNIPMDSVQKKRNEWKEKRMKLLKVERENYLKQRRREVIQEKEYRQRVKDQIEEDKRNRKAIYGTTTHDDAKTEKLQQVFQENLHLRQRKIKKAYSKTKLIIRLTNGDKITHVFASQDTLSAVRLFVNENRTDGETAFNLRTVYPNRTFSEEENETSLADLDLSPACVLIASRIKTKKSNIVPIINTSSTLN